MGTKGKKVIRAIDRITDAILMIFFALCLVLGLYIAYDSYYVYTQASSDRMSGFKPAVAEGENIDTGVLKELSKDVVGWLTIDGTSEESGSLTFATLGEDFKRENRASWDWRDVVASAVVLGVVIACYVYFWNWLGE